MAIALAFLALACLGFILWLTVDGLRAMRARGAAETRKKPLRLVVAERREVAGSLLCLRLKAPRGRILPGFRAGQHVLVQAPAGPGGKTIQRAYSLAAWQARPGFYELGIKREEPGAMTQWLWDNLREGSRLSVSRPQGQFTVPPSGRPLVLVGGGIGITPMRAMLHEALAEGRVIALFQAARTAEQLLYREEFEQLARAHAHVRYIPVLSRPDGSWAGLGGRLTAALILSGARVGAEAEFCLCAGEAMMAQLGADLVAAGVTSDRIHKEAFGVAGASGVAGIAVSVQANGVAREFMTNGAPTLLAELEAQEIGLPSECRAGSCGQCLVGLDAGEVDWLVRPEFAVPEGKILPCVCAPRSPLALSLP